MALKTVKLQEIKVKAVDEVEPERARCRFLFDGGGVTSLRQSAGQSVIDQIDGLQNGPKMAKIFS